MTRSILLLPIPIILMMITVVVTMVTTTGAANVLQHAYDDWCQENCATSQQCSEQFGDNFVELRVRVTNFSALEGPGESLTNGIFLGDGVARQSFHTQFILDISSALSISPCRLHITAVSPERFDDIDLSSWDSRSVFVTFRLLPVEISTIRNLTAHIQDQSSDIYNGKVVSSAIDPLYGLVATKWDFTLKLSIDISIVGQDSVKNLDDLQYLNQGSERWCLDLSNALTPYCEFEDFFRKDLAFALSMQPEMIDVLFVKPEGEGSVIVTFRFMPDLSRGSVDQAGGAAWIHAKITSLVQQMSDHDSHLYQGNVTFRVDPTWGVSNEDKVLRIDTKYLVRSVQQSSPDDKYERCKATHRCSRGWTSYNQSSSQSSSTMQAFAGGEHSDIPLFADFEDWRQGTRGWRRSSTRSSRQREVDYTLAPPGAHWSPFDFVALGAQIPSFNTSSNNGLVLNNASLNTQLDQQSAWIARIREYIGWLRTEMNISSLDATTRSRADIQMQMTQTMSDYKEMLSHEEAKYVTLSKSQCSDTDTSSSPCSLHFNTSSLEMTGAISATGEVAVTPDGTEVAVWAFDSIDLDENVKVTLTGQRALSLVSRSSVRISTALRARPGTLGGFPGGYSVSRRRTDRLVAVCGKDVNSTSLIGDKCSGDQPITTLSKGSVLSNNANGPGSGSVRVYLKTIETRASIEDRVQTIIVDANQGQTLAGGFKLHFNGYSTTLIPHDATARKVKEVIEDSLNPTRLGAMDKIDRTNIVQGVGEVSVERKSIGTSGGNVWTVTYASAVGTQGSNLTATNSLKGKGAFVTIQTLSEGNTIGGNFSISFLGNTTRAIPHDVSAGRLEQILLQDMTDLEHVNVLRSAPTNKCDAGLCTNGPTRSGGYIWTLTLTTLVGNVSPFSPTSDESDIEGEFATMAVKTNSLTGCVHVEATCPEVNITDGHGKSHVQAMKNLVVAKPFSLAYGGAGAGYGGKGGQGFGSNHAGQPYGDEYIANLHGGSGGALGLTQPFEVIMFGGPRARGGSGGGAIEIVATNDILLGPHAVLSCDGEKGFASFMTGGGGGSGGTVLLSAGGSIHHEGVISVNGGAGGRASQPDGHQDLVDGHGGGGGGGRVAMYGESIVLEPKSEIIVEGGRCPTDDIANGIRERLCDGDNGTVHLEPRLWHKMYVDNDKGAAGTSSSLRLNSSVRSKGRPNKKPYNRTLATRAGPEFDLGESKRPGRISFFVQIGAAAAPADGIVSELRTAEDWGAMIELRSKRWSEVTRSSAESNSTTGTAFIGILIGRDMKHGANIRAIPHDDTHHITMGSFLSPTKAQQWYKVDIRLNWKDLDYEIFLDDTLVVRQAPFDAEGMETMALANFDSSMDVWFDEIFVGDDTTTGFRCPHAIGSGEVSMKRPNRRGWKSSEIGGTSYLHDMQRHESHVSRRALYNRQQNAIIVPYDGAGHKAFTLDVKFRQDADNLEDSNDRILAGSLLQVQPEQGMKIEALPSAAALDDNNNELHHHGQSPLTYVWYGEHDNSMHDDRDGYISGSNNNHARGGVAACSTQDFISWKNEGIMLHYTNMTDMVKNSAAAAAAAAEVTGDAPYHVERPQVLYNNSTAKYVMWMILDNEARDLAMAGVAVSDYATGPFDFVRSFYPDGNQTRDQTLVQESDGAAYLIRSYYATVEFVLPSAIMQPTWESVKDANGNIDFASTYHRAHYEPQYDDYHDIYLQRWRTEDKPWKVVCVDRITGTEREVPFGKDHLNHDGEVCDDPFEYKKVLGQGNPSQHNTKDGIPSRFLDPNDPANNAWRPSSVPGVKAQPWSANYRDGTCGIRQVDDGKDHLDPTLPDRDMPDRSSCSNIADNPTHRTAPDKLIGKDRIVETRRAKFVAMSRLTDDYLDTTGHLTSFEGELEEGTDLIALVAQAKKLASAASMPFGWSIDSEDATNIGSTYLPQVHASSFEQARDWDTRYHQYNENYNDRAWYSLSCLVDGDGHCPVDFKTQITDGHT